MPFVVHKEVIKKETFEPEARTLGPPWECDQCGSTDKCRIFSFDAYRGRMYFVYRQETGFDSTRCLKLCELSVASF